MRRRDAFRLLVPAAVGLAAPLRAAGVVRLAVVVGLDSPLVDVELETLRRLFGGDPVADPRGRALIPFNHPPLSPDRVGFDQRVLGMSADQVAKYWVDRRIRGQPGPPRTATSLRMLLGVVSKLSGAIGYARAEYVTSEVKLVKVAGKLPSAPGYALSFGE